jgi:hypothetical protein
MNERSLAISILQSARDRLSQRLTQRVIESRGEIEDDADGGSYLSEIETLYDQLGSRLAHVNAMLSNLPPVAAPAPADATATEIIYADLASAYPTGFEVETAGQPPMLGLPAPAGSSARVEDPLAEVLARIATQVQVGDMTGAARQISECFDLRPSQARRWARSFARQITRYPELPGRLTQLAGVLDEADEQAAAALVAECFETQAAEVLGLVRALRRRLTDGDHAP